MCLIAVFLEDPDRVNQDHVEHSLVSSFQGLEVLPLVFDSDIVGAWNL
jgi:hypothetical protein